ncbi:hypothetical protein KX729_27540 [Rhizobium sp. XQZ8]|nr:hypothetical protein [Rhizobium populisoli]MBW6425194.1 hypothetical protein [Rhizobium populisoli]
MSKADRQWRELVLPETDTQGRLTVSGGLGGITAEMAEARDEIKAST